MRALHKRLKKTDLPSKRLVTRSCGVFVDSQDQDSLLQSVYIFVRRLIRTARYFLEILRGDMSGLSRAPAIAKTALRIRQKSAVSPIATSRLPSSQEVWDACVDSRAATGIWPISFSYPRPPLPRSSVQSPTLCPVFPGHSYTFTDELDYLEAYGRHLFALTHRKSGWDCFRHLEILASGAIPFMPDASLIPEHTMVHYPKKFLSDVASHLLMSRGIIGPEVLKEVSEYFSRHLTTRAMASYLLKVAPAVTSGRIFFVDDVLNSSPDYQSVLTLIGLKQVFESRVTVSTPIPYIYTDWSGSSDEMYGRGFGYTKVLPAVQKSEVEILNQVRGVDDGVPADIDLLVVGSITRNFERALGLLHIFPPERTVWIHGEDQGPSGEDVSRYRDYGVSVFARELTVT